MLTNLIKRYANWIANKSWKNRSTKGKVAVVFGATLVLGGVLSMTDGKEKPREQTASISVDLDGEGTSQDMTTTVPRGSNLPTSVPTTTPAIPKTTPPISAISPPTTPAQTQAPTTPAPSETASQRNARQKALEYLRYSSFSRGGLIDQLEYEKFSTADATYAVDAINVNWRDQAVKKAQEYLRYSSFSRSGLISQLEYEQFSNADSTYAVDSLNPNWNEQAVKKAQEYLRYSSFSRGGLIDQLVYEGFSQAQAEYGVNATGL